MSSPDRKFHLSQMSAIDSTVKVLDTNNKPVYFDHCSITIKIDKAKNVLGRDHASKLFSSIH
jgi:hypothetical protein